MFNIYTYSIYILYIFNICIVNNTALLKGELIMITDTDVDTAEMRMQTILDATSRAIAAHYDHRTSRIVISLSSGLELEFSPHIVESLSEAKPADLMDIEISPTGLGLHFGVVSPKPRNLFVEMSFC